MKIHLKIDRPIPNLLVIARERALVEFFKKYSNKDLVYGQPRARKRQLMRWLDKMKVTLNFEDATEDRPYDFDVESPDIDFYLNVKVNLRPDLNEIELDLKFLPFVYEDD